MCTTCNVSVTSKKLWFHSLEPLLKLAEFLVEMIGVWRQLTLNWSSQTLLNLIFSTKLVDLLKNEDSRVLVYINNIEKVW